MPKYVLWDGCENTEICKPCVNCGFYGLSDTPLTCGTGKRPKTIFKPYDNYPGGLSCYDCEAVTCLMSWLESEAYLSGSPQFSGYTSLSESQAQAIVDQANLENTNPNILWEFEAVFPYDFWGLTCFEVVVNNIAEP